MSARPVAPPEGPRYVGIDVGSVSVKTAVVDSGGALLGAWYRRHRGHPLSVMEGMLRELLAAHPLHLIRAVAATGSGGRLACEILGAEFVNEIIAQARAAARLCPGARTIIEMGGEDSKLILVRDDPSSDRGIIEDFSMNTVCAAGTGSFLDQQASRLGLSIEREFGERALRSQRPRASPGGARSSPSPT